jgi:hypothetical protein
MTTSRLSLLPLFAILTLATALAVARAGAPRPRAEIRIASFHAALAYGMPNVAGAHLHLHHVLNCLVPPSSPHFDPHVLEPCRGLGNGALADVPSGPAHTLLVRAFRLALRAEGSRSFPLVHALAGQVHTDLVRALADLAKTKH